MVCRTFFSCMNTAHMSCSHVHLGRLRSLLDGVMQDANERGMRSYSASELRINNTRLWLLVRVTPAEGGINH